MNDYGNILTMEDQRDLRAKINELEEAKGIGLTLLISTRDPYQNPDIYASRIRSKWDLRGKRNESFILFLQEGSGWAVRTFFSTSLLNLFTAEEIKRYQETLSGRAEDNDIRMGVLHGINTIYKKAFPSEPVPSEKTDGSSGLPAVYIILGGTVGGILLVFLLIRWEAMRRCPECGSRMKISRSRSDFGEETVKHCPECGYSETK